jgi:hypothetical protein
MVLKATVSHFEDVDSHKVYVTNVDNGSSKWQLKFRYSEFEIFYKNVKPDVAGVIFPGLCRTMLNTPLTSLCCKKAKAVSLEG